MSKLTIHYRGDLYVILHTDVAIVRIEKFIGDSQMRLSITFDELPEKLKEEVISQMEGEEE